MGVFMGQLIVRNLDDRVIDDLKARAARQQRSLEAERNCDGFWSGRPPGG